jgi:hypothetical protein
VTVPVTPVVGIPPVRVAEMVVELPTVIGEVTLIVRDTAPLTVTVEHVPVKALLLVSPP